MPRNESQRGNEVAEKDAGRRRKLSMYPLTTDEALAAALRVKPEDMRKLEAARKAKPKKARKKP